MLQLQFFMPVIGHSTKFSVEDSEARISLPKVNIFKIKNIDASPWQRNLRTSRRHLLNY